MGWLSEISTFTTSSGTTCTITAPANGYAKGHFLVMGIIIPGTSLPSMTVSDTHSNSWTTDQSISTGASGTSAGVYQLSCVVTTAIPAGATITITAGSSVTRLVCVIEEFGDLITGSDVGTSNNNGGSASSSLTSTATATTTQANELVVGTMGLVSPGRVYSPGSGYTQGTFTASTSGSSDRAIVLQWRYRTTTGTQTSSGTLNSGSIYGALVETYKISTPSLSWISTV